MAAISVPILTITIINIFNSHDSIVPEFEGNTFFSNDYLHAGYGPFKNSTDIEIFIKGILNKYNNAGFPFCSIKPEFIDIDSMTRKLVLHITEGERVTIKDYLFKTDGKTESGPLRKIAHIQKDQYFSLHSIERVKKALFRTGVFSSVNEYILKKDEIYFLFFELKERPSDYIVATGSFAEISNYFTVNLSSLNILGSLRQFKFQYESSISGEENKKLFQLNFTEPIILHPILFNADLSIWTYDSARLAKFEGTFITPLNNYLSLLVSSGIEMTNYLTDTGNFNYKHTILRTGLESAYYGNRFIINNNVTFDYLFRKNERMRIKYDGTLGYMNFIFKPHFHLTITDNFEYFDYIRLGGASSLRGYMEDEFLVKMSIWANIEYKLLPIYPLFDIAWFNDDYTYSYGAGIDARTSIANASLIFAWPEHGKWNDGKVHLLLEKAL